MVPHRYLALVLPIGKTLASALGVKGVAFGSSLLTSSVRIHKQSSQTSGPPLNGPLLPQIFADPAVIQVGDAYYAYATNANGLHIPFANSSNFDDWHISAQDALPNPGSWVTTGKEKDIWAPDVVKIVSLVGFANL